MTRENCQYEVLGSWVEVHQEVVDIEIILGAGRSHVSMVGLGILTDCSNNSSKSY